MSRIFRSDEVAVGERVVVRRKIGEHFSDVIGHVESVDPLVIRPQEVGGFPSSLPTIAITPEELHIIKRLSPRRVRNSDIRAVETATALAFPGREQQWCGGWLARAGHEIAERSNSATPLGRSVGFQPLPIDEITEFYRARDMPVQLLIPERIGAAAEKWVTQHEGWTLSPEILVMTCPLDPRGHDTLPPSGHNNQHYTFRIDAEPDQDWLGMYHFRGQKLPVEALRELSQTIEGELGFGRLLNTDGHTVAITRGTITESPDGRRWLGYSAVEVAPDYRRQGLGTRLGSEMLQWGVRRQATHAYLQVISTNQAGIGLYEKLGFVEHHRHRYASLDADHLGADH
ncbi:N-acetylglutamate synthase, CG3035 family [Corynebacterium cystitidis]|uniref:Acetyltransferase (GNAT) family protein n=1 Tax=Corynebacterium cystitidis DSM 20524 TaxID=1121357 RepID=A0A1H9V610_9CORY|nr:GNAT family N-acetyltransferase [Corynebacterium cystitidis]WJY83344.1 ribosomal-protein-alanine N-acetyltransferase [Corynebacterium cystitidis DSM 20524]SES16703.1 Acetyltransferase (GNAT) family protein [Corynebacterium cystitidis DSM 20524]SNV62971.1 Acetyltransferase [Corynebacterium cystitidis]